MFIFENKKILFIGPKTFNYENVIKHELESQGAEVHYISDKPFSNKILIIILRIWPKVLWSLSKIHYKKKLKRFSINYFDVIFIIKGEGLSPSLLEWMKSRYKSALFILYLWDSINNVKSVDQKFKYFDKILSFDPEDCKKFDYIKYRPLFFSNNYLNDVSNTGNNERLYFLGTLNGDRRKVVSRIISLLEKTNVKLDISLLVRSNLEFLAYTSKVYFCKLLGISILEIPSNMLIRQPLSSNEINNRMSFADAVLDVQHPKQSGLTMRTFEVLASGKKLITTNVNIEGHDFYDPSLISIIDRNNPIIDLDFFKSYPNKIDLSFKQKYSCIGWLNEIFN